MRQAWRSLTRPNPYDQEAVKAKREEQIMASAIALKDLREFAELSAEMLQDQRYGKLRDRYRRILEENLRLLIWYEPPVGSADRQAVYLETMRKLQVKIQVLTQLVEMPKEFVAKAQQAQDVPLVPKPASYAVGG